MQDMRWAPTCRAMIQNIGASVSCLITHQHETRLSPTQKGKKLPLHLAWYGIFIFLCQPMALALATGHEFRWRLQQRLTFSESTDGQAQNMEIRRFRLRFQGPISPAYEEWSYNIQLGFTRADQATTDLGEGGNILRDAQAIWRYHPSHRLIFGLRKLPGNRQRVISSGALEFSDRSIVNREFNLDRDVGVFSYQEWGQDTLWRLQIAASSGLGRGTPARTDQKLAGTVRGEWLPWGAFQEGSDLIEGDLLFHERARLAIGLGTHYNPRAGRLKGTHGTLLTASQQLQLQHHFVDFLWKWNGWAVSGEGFLRNGQSNWNEPNLQAQGALLQASYLTRMGLWAFRHAQVIGLQTPMTQTEWALGWTYPWHKHAMKFQAEWAQIDHEPWIRFQFEVGSP